MSAHSSRTLTESEKKIVAARQEWRCSSCACILPAAYQVDHTVPLCDGGADAISNCTAMCPNCHAAKTQEEAIQRAKTSKSNSELYAGRVDIFVSKNVVKCSLCFMCRDVNVDHMVCSAIEMPGVKNYVMKHRLSQYAFSPNRKR